jgi:hypothetical protein
MEVVRSVVRRVTLVALVAAGLIPVLALPAWACECVPGGVPATAPRADAVFTGVLRGMSGDHLTLQAEFAVEWVYRGAVGDEVAVATPAQGGPACGYHSWTVGDRYTIVANDLDVGLTTNICLGILRGPIDHEVYGLPAGSPRYPPPAGYAWWVYPGGILLGLLGGALIVRSLRRRRDQASEGER